MNRRTFLTSSSLTGLGILGSSCTGSANQSPFEYEEIRWIDEQQDHSLTLETDNLVAKIIDNTGLRVSQDSLWSEIPYSHHLGYHGIRALWDKKEKRNIVAPFVSWLNLQGLSIDSLELDPVDSRARFGVGRGWPVEMSRQNEAAQLQIPRMPVSGIEYTLSIHPSGPNSFDFEVRFLLNRKPQESQAPVHASWPCYMSTFDDVRLWAPVGTKQRYEWTPFGEREPFIVGEPVNYAHSQTRFSPPEPTAFSAVYGRIGERTLIIMTDSPDVNFFIINAGGHRPYFPSQNPAWDFSLDLPDYEVGIPFGFRGRLIYKKWASEADVSREYEEWEGSLR